MTLPAMTLLTHFEAAAKAAQASETELRKALAQQIAKAERHRAYAFRRTRLVRALATHDIAPNDTVDAAWVAQKKSVCEELGWSVISESHQVILTHMQPLAAAVQVCVSAPEELPATAVLHELETFETWFEQAHGKSFYVLFDQYVPQVPLVDF